MQSCEPQPCAHVSVVPMHVHNSKGGRHAAAGTKEERSAQLCRRRLSWRSVRTTDLGDVQLPRVLPARRAARNHWAQRSSGGHPRAPPSSCHQGSRPLRHTRAQAPSKIRVRPTTSHARQQMQADDRSSDCLRTAAIGLRGVAPLCTPPLRETSRRIIATAAAARPARSGVAVGSLDDEKLGTSGVRFTGSVAPEAAPLLSPCRAGCGVRVPAAAAAAAGASAVSVWFVCPSLLPGTAATAPATVDLGCSTLKHSIGPPELCSFTWYRVAPSGPGIGSETFRVDPAAALNVRICLPRMAGS